MTQAAPEPTAEGLGPARPDASGPPGPAVAPVPAASAASTAPTARRGPLHRLGDWIVAVLVIGAMELVQRMPERPLWWLGNTAGRIEYAVARKRRDMARENLRRVVTWMAARGVGAEKYRGAATDERALEGLVKAAFRNHAHYYVEVARTPRFDFDYIANRVLVETPAEVDAALYARRALILVGLHFGPIEIPGLIAVNRLGRCVAPMETLRNERVQAYITRTRATIGVRILTIEEAGHELLAVLRNNEPIGIIADRDLTGGGLEVELFGARTKIPAGPALLSAETGAPVYVAAVRRMGPGRYIGNLRPLPSISGVARRERSRAMAREEAILFERVIVDAPEQWLAIFHNIWPDLTPAASRRHDREQ